MLNETLFSRRDLLTRCGAGFSMIGLANVLAADTPAADPLAPKVAHHPARAKHIIHLYMNGGPSQVDTFDPKPAPPRFRRPAPRQHRRLSHRERDRRPQANAVCSARCGQSGAARISEIFPNVANTCGRSLRHPLDAHRDIPNHEPSML